MAMILRPRPLRRTNTAAMITDPRYIKLKKYMDDKWKEINFAKISEVMHLDNDNDYLYR